MIPRLAASSAVSGEVKDFLQTLEAHSEFQGEVDGAISSRLVLATDNSVYQVLPQAVIFPKTQQDIVTLFTLASQKKYHTISFAPRGGGTGTNGQSLSAGIIVDCSRHMNKILEMNLDEGWVLVEPGVVLDQLNEYLKPYDRFFAPTLSPSSRATLGGMANTDASGKGSRLYGKTSQHVLEITAVYADGQLHTSKAISIDEVEQMKRLPGRVGQFYQQLEQTVNQHQERIKEHFPNLRRFITGYNLKHIYSPDGKEFNANAVLTGSEGTLAYVTKLKLKLTPIPKHKCLFVVLYSSFSEALDHAKHLLEFEPAAIETMDGTVLNLAKTDIIYHSVKPFLKVEDDIEIDAINLIELVAHEQKDLSRQTNTLKEHLSAYDCNFVDTLEDINNLWELRKRSVGLLGKVKGRSKPISGVEDTVVPPEHLAEYVKEFREILDAHKLEYGMFGHIDVGCLHVRPAFNLMEEQDRQAYYDITEKVAQLTKKYGGVLWGEHGKGFRSEFVPMFFGDVLYEELRKIKSSCDPHNQLNPGKIAVPLQHNDPLVNIRSEKTRAHNDSQISESYRDPYHLALNCNGNGACFDYNVRDVMCPSYKITRDRIHSPKGRASLTREWLRQLSVHQQTNQTAWPFSKMFHSLQKKRGYYDFSHEVYKAMEGCLACQACKSQCPVNINVPSFKAKFLNAYHSRYARPVKDYLIAYSERLGYYQSKFPRLNNFFLANPLIKWIMRKMAGFVDPPLFSHPGLPVLLKQNDIPLLNLEQLPSSEKTLVFIQDWVTSFYEAGLVIKTCNLIKKLGFKVNVMPWFENGKTFHVTGMLKHFAAIAHKHSLNLRKIKAHGLPMVGLDPTMVLTFRYDYTEVLNEPLDFAVLLIQEWLFQQISAHEIPQPAPPPDIPSEYLLLSHCTEQANLSEALEQWQRVFSYFGLKLFPQKTGCCGMAGAYGHESKHQNQSRGLFELSWKPYFKEDALLATTLVDGYSCRAQIKRYTGLQAKHPVEILLKALN